MLKATGVVRQVDSLGRVVIPIELRRTFDIKETDSLEIFVDEQGIVLRKYAPGCAGCGTTVQQLLVHRNKLYCLKCVDEFAHMANLAVRG